MAVAFLTTPERAGAISGSSVRQELLQECRKATSGYFFQTVNGRRNLVGTLDLKSNRFREFILALQQAEPVANQAPVRADSEVALVGPSLQLLARINSRIHEVSLLRVRKWKADLTLTVRLNERSLQSVRASVKNYTVPALRTRQIPRSRIFSHWEDLGSLYGLVNGRGGWNRALGLKPPVVVVIARVLRVARNVYFQNPEWRDRQFTTFELTVDRYLKDETGLNLPVIKYTQNGGHLNGGEEYVDARLLLVGERYLLFLIAPQLGDTWSSEFCRAKGKADLFPLARKWSSEFLDGEFKSVHPFARTWLVDGVMTATVDLSPAERLAGGSTLHFRPEADVIAEVETAIQAF